MNVWRRLARVLPPEYSEFNDVAKSLESISRYTQLPVEFHVSRETLDNIDSFYCCDGGSDTWFIRLREELAKKDLELHVTPLGLLVRPAPEYLESETDDTDSPSKVKVIYEITELSVRSEDLSPMIYNVVNPSNWDENGGEGECKIVTTRDGRYLVVFQSEDIQANVLTFLEALAAISVDPLSLHHRGSNGSGIRGGLIRCAMQPTTQAMVSLLESKTPSPLRRQLLLPELVEFLKSRGLAVHHDLLNAADFQLAKTKRVDLRQDLGNFYNDLSHALSRTGLVMCVSKDRIEFLNPNNGYERDFEWMLYDSTTLQISHESLSQLLMISVSPYDWEDNGGDGTLVVAKVGNRQVVAVRQSPQIQWQVRRFLERLGDFVVASRPVDGWVSGSTPIALPTVRMPHLGISQVVSLPQPTEGVAKQPDTLTAESWPVHELQVDFWPESKDPEQFEQYPIFYDITSLDADHEVVYEMLYQLVDPDHWEENGGRSTSVIEQFGSKRILVIRTTAPHHDAIARFFERLSQALGIPPLRSNWNFEWVPAQVRASEQNAGPHAKEVEFYELRGSNVDHEFFRQTVMENIAPDTWSENGGDYELVLARINQRQFLAVHQQRGVQQVIKRLLRDRH